MIVCNSKMYVVYHMEKTGGTTVEKSIAPHLQEGDIYLSNWERINLTERDINISEHGTPREVAFLLGRDFSSFKHFATVREPVSLMTSMYKFAKHLYDTAPSKDDVPEGAPMAYKESLAKGPDHFLEHLFIRNYRMVQTQASRLREIVYSGMLVDTAQLDSRWDEIMQFLGYTNVRMVRHHVSAPSKFSFSDRGIRMIKSRFAEDYDVLPRFTGTRW